MLNSKMLVTKELYYLEIRNIIRTFVTMEIISREGSQVIIKDKSGRVWLTRRIKRKKDSRRRAISHYSVRYIPIKELLSQ